MRANCLSTIIWLATAGGVLTSAAQAPDIARDQPGRWVIKNGGRVVKVVAPSDSIDVPIRFPAVVTADERPHVQAWINQLVEILRRSPTLTQPRGFDVSVNAPSIDLTNVDDQSESKQPLYVAAALTIVLTPYEQSPKGPAANDAHAAARIDFAVNRPAGVLVGTHAAGNGVTASDEGVEFLQEPVPPDETRHGLPLYLGARVDQWHILMTRSRAPMFAPVTREQFLRSVMDTVQKQYSRAGPLQALLDGMTKQLAAMSAAERGAATYLWNTGPNDSGRIEFLQEGEKDALPVVRRNPALMDDRLPRWTPQVLVVTFEGDDRWPGLAAKLDEELDWTGLAKFLGSSALGK
jgi:hypothetical protein